MTSLYANNQASGYGNTGMGTGKGKSGGYGGGGGEDSYGMTAGNDGNYQYGNTEYGSYTGRSNNS